MLSQTKVSNRKLRLTTSNPYASNFAINKSCDKQSYALDKSVFLIKNKVIRILGFEIKKRTLKMAHLKKD